MKVYGLYYYKEGFHHSLKPGEGVTKLRRITDSIEAALELLRGTYHYTIVDIVDCNQFKLVFCKDESSQNTFVIVSHRVFSSKAKNT